MNIFERNNITYVERNGLVRPAIAAPDPVLDRIPRDGIDGVDGRDGVDGISPEPPEPITWNHRGKWRRQQYQINDVCFTSEGSFLCIHKTQTKPPTKAWRVLCLSGKDGKDGKNGRPGRDGKDAHAVAMAWARAGKDGKDGVGSGISPIAAIFDEAITAGQVVYVPSDGHAALADNTSNPGAAGIALTSAGDGEAGTYQTEGVIELSSLSAGSVYYLGSNGAMTTTAPSTGFVVVLGRALSSTEFDISIVPGVKL